MYTFDVLIQRSMKSHFNAMRMRHLFLNGSNFLRRSLKLIFVVDSWTRRLAVTHIFDLSELKKYNVYKTDVFFLNSFLQPLYPLSLVERVVLTQPSYISVFRIFICTFLYFFKWSISYFSGLWDHMAMIMHCKFKIVPCPLHISYLWW